MEFEYRKRFNIDGNDKEEYSLMTIESVVVVVQITELDPFDIVAEGVV